MIVDYTSDVDDVEARMVMLKPENRTALIDAVYLGINKLKQAKYERKALLIIRTAATTGAGTARASCGAWCGKATCRFTRSGFSTRMRRRTRRQLGPGLLTDISEMTGGQMFKVTNVGGHGGYCDADQPGAAERVRGGVPAERYEEGRELA